MACHVPRGIFHCSAWLRQGKPRLVNPSMVNPWQRTCPRVSIWQVSNTPSQSTGCCCPRKQPRRVLLLQVPCADFAVVLGVEVFCELVCQIFLAWVPLHVECPILDLVCHPEKISFPSSVNVVSSRCHLQFLWLCYCRSGLVLVAVCGPILPT